MYIRLRLKMIEVAVTGSDSVTIENGPDGVSEH